MPANANTYNTRITSEALEAAFRERFPAQGGAELVDDLYASGVIQPVFDLATTTAGGALPQQLQTAWDFSTGSIQINNASYQTIINNTGFWLVDLSSTAFDTSSVSVSQIIRISDVSSSKNVWARTSVAASATVSSMVEAKFVVFLRSGDSLEGKTQGTGANNDFLDIWYRQIADVNGNVVNPLGFTFS